MAKRDNTRVEIPHLAEGYALAQVLSDSEEQAFQATVAVFSAHAENRFDLLRRMLQDLKPEPPPPHDGVPIPQDALAGAAPSVVAPAADAPDQPSPAPESSISGPSAPAAATPESPSLVVSRIRDEARSQALLQRYARLSQTDRAHAFLLASSRLAAADLAGLLGVSADEANLRTSAVLEELGFEDELQDATLLSRALEPFIRTPGKALRGAILRARAEKRSSPRRNRGRVLPVIGVLTLAVVAALAVSRFLAPRPSGPGPQPAAQDALEAAAQSLPSSQVDFPTSDPEEAVAWLEGQLTWSFETPQIAGPPLMGASFSGLVSGVRIPTLNYGTSEVELSVGVINYAVLERESNRLMLDRETLDRLADSLPPAQLERDGKSALIVRNRDDLYLAVSRQIDVGLGNRITFGD